MHINYAFIRSKVARRVVWLFFISALLPISFTAIYSFSYVNDLLVKQSYKQLQHSSKLYGMAVLDRLLFVDSKLRDMTKNLDLSKINSTSVLFRQDNENTDGRPIETPFVEIKIEKSAQGKAQSISSDDKSLIYTKTEKGGNTGIFMKRIAGIDKNYKLVTLVAQLNNNYIWGNKNTLPFSTYLCVLDDSGKVLFCPNHEYESLLAKIEQNKNSSDPRKLVWVNKEGRNLAVSWDLFIKSNFYGPDWKIISSRPESDALLPVYAYHKIFPLIIALSLLGVLLLSLIQVRRIMLPLEKLVKATGRLARYEFGNPVKVDSADEFGELADSFNAMAVRLEKQFNILKILSDIDHLILSNPDLDVVISNIFDSAHKIVSCDFIVVSLLDKDDLNDSFSYIKEVTGNKQAYVEHTAVKQQEIEDLKQQTEVQLRDLAARPLFCMESVIKEGVSTAQICPIFLDGDVRAIFCLGYRRNAVEHLENVGLVADIIDRLAVALATTDRDEKLYRQAHFDFLTGLPNRQLFIV